MRTLWGEKGRREQLAVKSEVLRWRKAGDREREGEREITGMERKNFIVEKRDAIDFASIFAKIHSFIKKYTYF